MPRRLSWTPVAFLFLSCLTPAEEGFGPATVRPEAHAFRLGDLDLVALHDARYVAANDGKTFGVDVGPAAVATRLKAHGLPEDRIVLSVNALLVKSAGHLALIDTGLGAKLHGRLGESLKQAGVAEGSISDVLITHSHGDHTGGLIDVDGRLAFPKATIHMAAAEWEDLSKQDGAADLVKRIRPRVRTFNPGAEVLPGIRSLDLPGHTPGHVGFEIGRAGVERLLDIGDLAHSSLISLAAPDWAMGFDGDAGRAKQTRRETLARLARTQELVFSPHFPFPGLGRVAVEGEGFAWVPAKP